MTKAELVAKMAEQTGLKKSQAEKALNAFTNALTQALGKGERIAIPGLGVFNVKERAERTGRNPKTGEEIIIPAKKVVKFTASKALQAAVNG